MKKSFVMACVLAAVLVPAAAQNVTDTTIFGIETGFLAGFDLDESEFGPATTLAMNLSVADNLVVGFYGLRNGIGGASSYSFFRTQLFVSANLGVEIMLGSTGADNMAGGAGFFFNVLQRTSPGPITTVLQLKLEYLLTEDVNTSGSIFAGLSGRIGI